jgi:copper chaperone NosL
MNKKLQPVTRIITLLSSIGLVAVLFLPMWTIDLTAPQYPEGLSLVIYPHKLGGDVDDQRPQPLYKCALHTQDFVFTLLPSDRGLTFRFRRW